MYFAWKIMVPRLIQQTDTVLEPPGVVVLDYDDARKVLEKARDRKLAAFDAEEQEA